MRRKRQTQTCQRCSDHPAVFEEKFCKSCRKAVLDELKSSGYLTDPIPKQHRGDIGRKCRDLRVLGGSAEMGTDGDD